MGILQNWFHPRKQSQDDSLKRVKKCIVISYFITNHHKLMTKSSSYANTAIMCTDCTIIVNKNNLISCLLRLKARNDEYFTPRTHRG